MFERGADGDHLMRLEELIRGWADFVQEELDPTRDFQSIQVGPSSEDLMARPGRSPEFADWLCMGWRDEAARG
jgi:hypothetical protein